MFGRQKSEDKLSRYQDPTGEFSNRSLKLASWYVSHKLLLRKIFIIVLSVWSTVTIALGLFVWGKYLVVDYQHDEQMIAGISQTLLSIGQIRRVNQPQALSIGSLQLFNSATDKYDFVVEVYNPNERWLALPEYKFIYSGGETEVHEARLLPGQRQSLVVYGFTAARRPSAVRFELMGVKWKRIDPHQVFVPEKYMEQRLQFSTADLEFRAANRAQGLDTHSIKFSISNDSLFSYWEASFNLVYQSRGQVVGVTPLLIEQFRAGQTRTIELASLAEGLQVDSIRLEPLINVFAEDVYMPLR